MIVVGLEESEQQPEDQIKEILTSLGEDASEHVLSVQHAKRLGNQEPRKSRPILVTLATTEARNSLVDLARTNRALIQRGIRIKKDTHPAARAEWKRLHEVKAREAAKSENAGRAVALDWKKRQVTVDGNVVDTWNALF
jgi:hypothetical protein